MARYFSQEQLDGSIKIDNSHVDHRHIEITHARGYTIVTLPDSMWNTIISAQFNSDGVLVVHAEYSFGHIKKLRRTYFVFRPDSFNTIYEDDQFCNKPASNSSQLSRYNKLVLEARQEREGAKGVKEGASSSSGSASNAAAFGVGAAVGTALIKGIVNRREKKKLEKNQAEEAARQQKEAENEERKRQFKEQAEMAEQIELKEKEMEAYERKALLESMTPEERKAFLLQEREEKKKKEQEEKQEQKEWEEKMKVREAKKRKINLIFYPILLGLVIILHLWFWIDDDFEWWQASLWGLLTLGVGGLVVFIKGVFF